MSTFLQNIDSFLYREFIFSPRFRLWRHIFYWLLIVTLWAAFWVLMGEPTSFWRNLFNMMLWIPVFIVFSYPLVYFAIPQLLLKGKVLQFFLLGLLWGGIGLYINSGFRNYIFFPLQQAMGFDYISQNGYLSGSYLCMTTSAASPMIIKFFKVWTQRQRDWVQAQHEKITAELQLLKAQIHPHFLFNTLNNIYSFSLENSPKTPDMILKLSSLLSYMLYDCKGEKVRLEKEIEIMRNYIDLEKERYGNRIEVSWTIEGSMKDKFISPLLMLPFLENAFKHGTSEQIEKSWLSVKISLRSDILRCEIANSKNQVSQYHQHGIGINNVKRRLAFMYPNSHELSMQDEGKLFSVLLQLKLSDHTQAVLGVPSFTTQIIPA